MIEQRKDQLTGHNYDGIEEYDNPTPGWWWAIFWLTILFAPLYFLIVLAARGVLSPTGELARAQTAMQEKLFAGMQELQPDAQTILSFSQDVKWMSVARNWFAGNCAQCHGPTAAGLSGPNLTDDNYLWVKKAEDIYDVITHGRKQGAMPAWKTQMNQNQRVLLSAYVASLRGANVPGKDKEGDEIAPWPVVEPPAPTDSAENSQAFAH